MKMSVRFGAYLLFWMVCIVIFFAIQLSVVEAAPYPAARIIVLSENSDVTVEFQPSDAGCNNLFGLWSPTKVDLGWGHNTASGTVFNLGRFPAGTELVFFMTHPCSGNTWLNGPGERNPDGQVHASISDVAFQTWSVAFEDLPGGGDRDFNDISFIVRGDLGFAPPYIYCKPKLLSSYDYDVSGNMAYVGTSYEDACPAVWAVCPVHHLGSYDTPGLALDVYLSGNTAYVADYDGGLQIIDVSDPTAPVLLGSYVSGGLINAIYSVSGGKAYVSVYWGGSQVIDVSDPTNPTLLCSPSSIGGSFSWDTRYISGTTAYVVDLFGPLRIIDLGEYGFCNDGLDNDGDGLIDCNDPDCIDDSNCTGNPLVQPLCPTTLLGEYSAQDILYTIHISGSTAYLGGQTGLHIVDVSDPTNPTLLGKFDATPYFNSWPRSWEQPLKVFVSDNTAYVIVAYQIPWGGLGTKLWIIDVSIPSAPVLLATYQPGDLGTTDGMNYFADLYVSYNRVCVTTAEMWNGWGSGGLQVIDFSDPTNPILLGKYYTPQAGYPGSWVSIHVSGNRAVLANGNNGLHIIDLGGCPETFLEPSSATTTSTTMTEPTTTTTVPVILPPFIITTSSTSTTTTTTSTTTSSTTTTTTTTTTIPNTPPTANAGLDQTVHIGNVVTLNGSGSSDPDGNVPLTYEWSFVSKPIGSSASLSDTTIVNPTFTPDLTGDYGIQLIVTDSLGAVSDPDTVIISTMNSAPVVNAGNDQLVILIGTTVQLDGSQSYDLDGDPKTYQWTFDSKPGGSTASLSGANTAMPTFVADVHGDYVIKLVVSDPWSQSEPDFVTVGFENIKPVANAGTSQSVVVGDTVTLDGSGSSDANGDNLTYNWSLTAVPVGSSAQIANPTDTTTSFVPDLPGTYVVQLIVNDGYLDSDSSTIQVQVVTLQTVAISTIQNCSAGIASLSPTVFKNANMQNALLNKLNAVIANIEAGNYADALGQLQNDILGKTDGCANSGVPDKNDWIKDCAAQGLIYPCILDAIAKVEALML